MCGPLHVALNGSGLTRTQVTEVDPQLKEAEELDVQTRIRAAYEAGYKAGYQSGLKMEVTVDVEWLGRDAASTRTMAGLLEQDSLRLKALESSFGTTPASATSTASATASTVEPNPSSLHIDSWQRSATKGMTWRILSSATTMIIALAVFKDSMKFDEAMELGGLEFVSKYILYFIHERAWALVTML